MVDIPYHTHQFDIPTASEGEIRTGIEAGKAITPDKLFPVLADKANKATTLAGYGIVDAATKAQGQKADTAVQPAQVSAVGFTGRYDDLLNKPLLGGSSGLNVGTTTGTVAAGDDPRIVNAAQKSTTVSAGTGLSGGGTLAANITLALSSTSLASLALADSAVQPVRKITAGTGLTGGGDFSADRTIALNPASIASLTRADSAVQPVRKLTAGTGLSGGGDLSADRTVALNTASIASLARADSAVQASDLGILARKDKITTEDIVTTGSASGGALLTRDGIWVDPSGGGDMFRQTYDPTNKRADMFDMANMTEAANAKVMTAAERTKLSGIAAGATANTGTVTSVGVAVPAGLSATEAITTSGTITINYAAGYQGYTAAEANKLSAIEAGADKTTTTNVGTAIAGGALTGAINETAHRVVGADITGSKVIRFTFDAVKAWIKGWIGKADVGLGNVANKSEAEMVTSGAVKDALDKKFNVTGGKTSGGIEATSSLMVASDANTHVWYRTADGKPKALIYHDAAGNILSLRVYGDDNTSYVNVYIDKFGRVIAPALSTSSGDVDTRINANIGVGQSWVNVTGQRANNTVYVNNTGKPIAVSIRIDGTRDRWIDIFCNGVSVSSAYGWDSDSRSSNAFAIIPNGTQYTIKWNANGGITIMELR